MNGTDGLSGAIASLAEIGADRTGHEHMLLEALREIDRRLPRGLTICTECRHCETVQSDPPNQVGYPHHRCSSQAAIVESRTDPVDGSIGWWTQEDGSATKTPPKTMACDLVRWAKYKMICPHFEAKERP